MNRRNFDLFLTAIVPVIWGSPDMVWRRFCFLGLEFPVWHRSLARRSVMHLFVSIAALVIPPFDKDRAIPVVGATGRDIKIRRLWNF